MSNSNQKLTFSQKRSTNITIGNLARQSANCFALALLLTMFSTKPVLGTVWNLEIDPSAPSGGYKLKSGTTYGVLSLDPQGFDNFIRDKLYTDNGPTLNLGVGSFGTRGEFAIVNYLYAANTNAPGGFNVKSGWTINGAGKTLTTIKLVAIPANPSTAANGPGMAGSVLGTGDSSDTVINITIKNLTIDCNYPALSTTFPYLDIRGITLYGNSHKINNVSVINSSANANCRRAAGAEIFTIYIGANNAVSSGTISNCSVFSMYSAKVNMPMGNNITNAAYAGGLIDAYSVGTGSVGPLHNANSITSKWTGSITSCTADGTPPNGNNQRAFAGIVLANVGTAGTACTISGCTITGFYRGINCDTGHDYNCQITGNTINVSATDLTAIGCLFGATFEASTVSQNIFHLSGTCHGIMMFGPQRLPTNTLNPASPAWTGATNCTFNANNFVSNGFIAGSAFYLCGLRDDACWTGHPRKLNITVTSNEIKTFSVYTILNSNMSPYSNVFSGVPSGNFQYGNSANNAKMPAYYNRPTLATLQPGFGNPASVCPLQNPPVDCNTCETTTGITNILGSIECAL